MMTMIVPWSSLKFIKYFENYLTLKKYSYVPCWINAEVDISSDISSLIKKSSHLKGDVNRVKKEGFDYEITDDEGKFYFFYNKMYLPYLIRIYSDTALIWGYGAMRNKFKECNLLLIKKSKREINIFPDV